jgi:hypothetical protein
MQQLLVLTEPSFQSKGRLYHDRIIGLIFVPTLERVFGRLQPNDIAAGCDLVGELTGRLLFESPVRPTLLVLPAPGLHDFPGLVNDVN